MKARTSKGTWVYFQYILVDDRGQKYFYKVNVRTASEATEDILRAILTEWPAVDQRVRLATSTKYRLYGFHVIGVTSEGLPTMPAALDKPARPLPTMA